MKHDRWSPWQPFPDPRNGGYLSAPFGPGVYELHDRSTNQRVLFGESGNVACRMSSLLPAPHGVDSRSNNRKRKYVLDHLADFEYRTKSCKDRAQSLNLQRRMKQSNAYLFPT